LMKDNQHHGMNLHVHEGDTDIGDLRVWRDERRPDFGRHEAALLDAILPHFRNALLNTRMIRRAQGMEAFWTRLLDNIRVALFLLDEGGRLLYLNSGARKIEEELPTEEYSSFCDFVRSSIRENRLCTGWGRFSLSMLKTDSPQDARPITAVMAHPLTPEPISAEFLRARHGLTPRETEICIMVYKGLKDAEIARALGISFTTVRTHLEHLFVKRTSQTALSSSIACWKEP